jgi:hypothetical protein
MSHRRHVPHGAELGTRPVHPAVEQARATPVACGACACACAGDGPPSVEIEGGRRGRDEVAGGEIEAPVGGGERNG